MTNYYVRTSSAAGGTGAADSDAGATRAFSTSNEAEAGLQSILAEPMTVHCSTGSGTSADTTAVTIDGWTTTAANYLVWQLNASQSWGGKESSSIYRLAIANATAFTINEDFVRLKKLQIQVTSQNANGQSVLYLSTAGAGAIRYVEKCLLKGSADATRWQYGVRIDDADETVYMSRCVLYNFHTSPSSNEVISTNGFTDFRLYSCTINGGYFGIRNRTGTMYATNVICSNQGGGGGQGFLESSGTLYCQHCASSDATADDQDGDGTSHGNHINHTFSYVDSANGDFHLQSTDTGAIDLGTDLSGDAVYAVTDDIDEVTVSGTWDIGADEYAAAASGVPKQSDHYRRMRAA